MECRDLILDGLSRISDGMREHLAGLSADDLEWRPGDDANPIGWIAWHLTRVQDDHISELAGQPQAWLTDGWHARFDRPPDASDTGYGYSADEVGAFRTPSAEVLLAYHQAVYQRSTAYVQRVACADLDRIIDRRWDPPVTVGVRLISVVDDCAQHIGQIGYLRGLRRR